MMSSPWRISTSLPQSSHQLFFYMVGKGMQCGYVGTERAFVFLYIPEGPAMVCCHMSVPKENICYNDGFHSYCLGLRLVLKALDAKPPTQAWIDAAANLDT